MRNRVRQQSDQHEDGAYAADRVPMRWAIRADTRAVVHIASLSRDDTGLKCGCICPECDARLQAVNAGQPPAALRRPGSLGQFFRHDSGQQRSDCLFAAARLAALKLVLESGQLDLPPATATHDHVAPSGHAYTATATGTAMRARVANYQWIDHRSGSLTLPDGRRILVQLQAHNSASTASLWDAVLTITVNDPEVASWPAEKILEQMRLNPDFSCWDRHWQHSELNAQAQDDAIRKAVEAGDAFPEGLVYTGALPSASESPLHWVVKTLLAQIGRIRVPEATHVVTAAMPDRQIAKRVARVPAMVLELQDVRLEHRLPGIVPDVVCTARNRHAGISMDLLVEVAVTHKVDDAKLKKVAALGLACLELDATRFSVGGRVRLAQIGAAVFDDLHNKRWLHHPYLAAAVTNATQQLQQQFDAAEQAAERARARAAWMESRNGRQCREQYLAGLAAAASGTTLRLGEHDWHLQELAAALAGRGWDSANHEPLAGLNGILQTIHWLKTTPRNGWPAREAHAMERLNHFAESTPHQALVALLCMAFKLYAPPLSPRARERLDGTNRRIKESIADRQLTFARTTAHDSFVGYLFPELAQALEKPYGTQKAVEQARRAELERRRQVQEEERQRQLKQQNEQRLAREKEEVSRQIGAYSRFNWMRRTGLSRDPEQILDRVEVRRLIRSSWFRGIDAAAIVQSAWQAREDGVSLESWFRSQNATDLDTVSRISRLLKESWLVDQ